MTGFGKSECQLQDKKVYIEIKALNNKQVDINTKIPVIYKDKDVEIRNLLTRIFERGKIDFILYYELNEDISSSNINPAVVQSYYKQMSSIAKDLNIGLSNHILETIIRLPDALKNEKCELDDEEWNKLSVAINQAIDELDKFRIQEGKALEKDIRDRIFQINQMLSIIPSYEQERINKIKERINSNMKEFIPAENLDKNRFEQELLYYIEKLDITEEKVRLKNHCEYFLETIEKGGSIGKKLGFISQEIGREINTIGSKANHSEIQKIVVQMKDELEKIKEQLMNIL